MLNFSNITFARLSAGALLTVMTMLALSMMWEFGLEEWVCGVFGWDYDGDFEAAERWRFVATSTGFAAISLVAPFLMLHRALAALRRTHENLTQARIEAEAANRAKTDFLANMSHELRTPLNAIIGFSDIIQGEMFGPIEARYREYNGDILASGQHLLGIVNDILDITKAETDTLNMDIDTVDLSVVARRVHRMTAGLAEKKRVSLEVAENGAPLAKADEKRLTQAIVNLVANAIKFTPSGGVVTIRCGHDARGDNASVAIIDTGIGIAPEDIETALRPFGQIESAISRKYEGTGLGLPLAKKFVIAMGGGFTLRSEVGKGTAVFIDLPAARRSESAAGKAVGRSIELLVDRMPRI